MNHLKSRNFTRGFLLLNDPLQRLPEVFDALEEVERAFLKLNSSNYLRTTAAVHLPFPVDELQCRSEKERI